MSTQRWVEILVVGIVLAGLGWLSTTVFSMNATLSEVANSTENTTKRLDRIANVLPDVGVRIAQEELRKKVDFALVCSVPLWQADAGREGVGEWAVRVKLLDLKKREQIRYWLAIDGPNERVHLRLRHALRGAVGTPEDAAYFGQIIRWSKAADNDLELADSIDTDCSFVSRARNREDYEAQLSRYRNALALFDAVEAEHSPLHIESARVTSLITLLNEEGDSGGNG